MTIKQILDAFCKRVSDPIPVSINDNDEQTIQSLSFLETALFRVFSEYPWRSLVKNYKTVIYNNVCLLPSDFDSLLDPFILISSKKLFAFKDFDINQNTINIKDNIKSNTNLAFRYKSKFFLKSLDVANNVIYTDSISKDDDEVLMDSSLVILASQCVRSSFLQLADFQNLYSQY